MAKGQQTEFSIVFSGKSTGALREINRIIAGINKLEKTFNAASAGGKKQSGNTGTSASRVPFTATQNAERVRIAAQNAQTRASELLIKQQKVDAAVAQATAKRKTAVIQAAARIETAVLDKTAKVRRSKANERVAITKREIADIQALARITQSTNSLEAQRIRQQMQADRIANKSKPKDKGFDWDKLGKSFDKYTRKINTGLNKINRLVSRTVNGIVSAFSKATNSVRYLSQGLQEIGRTLLVSVAAPIALFTKQAFSFAADYEEAMIRVQKTTNNAFDMKTFSDQLRGYSRYTSTSLLDLATFAEQLGQVGIQNENAMMRMIRVSDMLATATDIDASVIAESLGRIASAFGYSLNTEEGVSNIEELSDIINYLENNTASSAGEIVTALLGVANAAGVLDIPAKELAAYSAMMVSAGVDAHAAGTRLSAWYTMVTQNTDKFATLMQGYKRDGVEIYTSQADVIAKLNSKPIEVLADSVEMLGSVTDGSRAQALGAYFDMFGRVGGKVAVLGGNVTYLRQLLDDLNAGAAKGSLWTEYNLALQGTNATLGAMKNNLSYAAVELGQTFLPIINDILTMVIPVIQALTAGFSNLPKSIQILAVAVPIVLAAITPILFAISSVVHGVSLIGMGFVTMLSGLASAVTSVISGVFTVATSVMSLLGGTLKTFVFLGKSIPKMIGGFKLLFGVIAGGGWKAVLAIVALIAAIGLIVLAVTQVPKIIKKIGNKIAEWFMRLADNALKWGQNMMKTFGQGLLGGAAMFVGRAVAKIASMIAGFFESHSPPEEGPLSTIDEWGSALMNTYLKGFLLADFSILSDVGSRIRQGLDILKNMGSVAEEELPAMYASARTQIANLLDIFNKTGQIATDVLSDIASNMGTLGTDLQKLIQLSLEYKQIQQEIANLEKQKKTTLKSYDDEIARIAKLNISAEEKAELIRRAAAARDKEIRRIEEEKAVQEELAEVKEGEVEWQREYIDAQLEQLSIFDDLKNAAGGISDALSEIEFGELGKGLTEGFVNPMEDAMNVLEQKVEKMRRILEAFWDGLLGKDKSEAFANFFNMDEDNPYFRLGIPMTNEKDFETGFGWGDKLGDTITPLREALQNLEPVIQDLGKKFEGLDFSKVDETLGTFKDMFSDITGALTDLTTDGIKINWFGTDNTTGGTSGIAQTGPNTIPPFWYGDPSMSSSDPAVAAETGAAMGVEVGAAVSEAILTSMPGLAPMSTMDASGMADFIGSDWFQGMKESKLIQALNTLIFGGGNTGTASIPSMGLGVGFSPFSMPSVPPLSTTVTVDTTAATQSLLGLQTTGQNTATSLQSFWSGVSTFFSNIWSGIKSGGETTWGAIKTAAETTGTALSNAWTSVKTTVGGVWEEIKSAGNTTITSVSSAFETFKGTVSGAIGSVKSTVTGLWDSIKSIVADLKSFLSGNHSYNINWSANFNNSGDERMAVGGIVTGPTRALIGEGTESEAVIPLSRLPILMGQLYGRQLDAAFGTGGGAAQGQTIIQINNPVVREDSDIEKIATAVDRVLTRRAKSQMRYGRR